jgi:hypothetical protein
VACRSVCIRRTAFAPAAFAPIAFALAPHERRRGSFIVEVVVAAALFSTAVFALGRLAQQTASLSVRADEQLGAQLTGENTLARLQLADYAQIPAIAKELETTEADAPYAIQIATKAVKIKGVDATVLSVEIYSQSHAVGQSAANSRGHSLILHDWRFAEPENGNE